MIKSLYRLLRVDPGFDTTNLLTLEVSYVGANYQQNIPCAEGPCRKVLDFCRNSIDKLQRLPGVESAAIVSQLPLGGNQDGYGIHAEGKLALNPEDDPSADRYAISTGYFRTMRIPLLRGRTFTEQDRDNAPLVVLVNNAAVQDIWPGEDPLGKRIRVGDPAGPWRTVIGVVGDVRHKSLEAPPTLQVYVPLAQWLDSSTTFILKTSSKTVQDPVSFSAVVRDALGSVDRNQTISKVAPMEQVIAVSIAERRFAELLFAIFSTIALLLAAAGIYGTVSYSVTHRTQEIGVRMALGAQSLDVLKLIAGEGMRPVLQGMILGLAVALALGHLLAGLLFQVRPADPLTIIAVTVLLAIVAVLASYLPARRATRTDPMVALRYE
jgi:putative ABC transport system permease protein